MGYRDNTFFNLPSSERNIRPGGAGTNWAPNTTNAPFLYPSSSIRFLEEQARVDNKDTADYRLERGYIRGLPVPAAGDYPLRSCRFQFNPQNIVQSVTVRSDMYLPILQDPAQFVQPIGGMTNFSFDLLFKFIFNYYQGNPCNIGGFFRWLR